MEGDEQVPGEREENRESEDDRSGVSLPSGTSLLRRLTSFSLLGNQDEDGDSFGAGKAHPKHCMCGCRAY